MVNNGNKRNLKLILQTLPKSGTKCVSEETHNNVIVVADYVVVVSENYRLPNSTISVTVTSPYGNIIHHKENVTHGTLAFASTESGLYRTCFSSDHSDEDGKLVVTIDWKIGVAAKDWESVARKEKIEGVELELRKLKEVVEGIQNNFFDLMRREAKMRDVSETTKSRVARYSISSLGICILATSAQLWYLTCFFRKKKLI
ncbi:transmembrane emp24 domain-containing protein p24delta4-like [Bidens hawaiensis]|uniref:transmembrane emp24 domain-containing protein p24delta4-like n=1 Tax=Bidens hawaiensis TaxID=980011 RepID=UPI0040498BF6